MFPNTEVSGKPNCSLFEKTTHSVQTKVVEAVMRTQICPGKLERGIAFGLDGKIPELKLRPTQLRLMRLGVSRDLLIAASLTPPEGNSWVTVQRSLEKEYQKINNRLKRRQLKKGTFK